MTTRRAVAVRHVVITGALVVVIAWLLRLGHGPLAGPSLSIDGMRAWIDRRDTVTLALSITRLEALAFASYLVGVTIVGGVARWLALPRTMRIADRCTPAVLRGVLGGVAALGVMAAPPPARLSSPMATPTTVAPTSTPSGDAHATLHLLPNADEKVTPPPVPEAIPQTWTVQPGDNLWLIAREHLIDETDGPVTDEAVLTHWHRLVDLNRDRLANPNDPDLIFADQVLDLPAVDAG